MSGRMTNSRFRTIVVPILGVVSVLALASTIAAISYSASLDMTLGRGARHVGEVSSISDDDISFYNIKHPNDNSGLSNTDPATAQENESRNDAAKVALKVAEEGITLLKNDGSLPLVKKSKVTPFGYRYIAPIWGGSGSASTNMNFDYVVTPEEAMKGYFTVNSTVETAMKAATATAHTSATVGDITYSNGSSTNMDILEYSPSIYAGTESSCSGTTGIVYIGRLGLEGNDLWAKEYADGTKHELTLTQDEKDMIAFAKANCDKVVVVCNFSNIMEINELKNDSKINAIVWLGNPGSMGCEALGEILTGAVNPSGRTVDTWLVDNTKDPSFNNALFGAYDNADLITKNYYEYEEGIYSGYQYYETAFKEAAAGNYSGFEYDNEVVYPFGFGLHYQNDKITQTLNNVHVSGETIIIDGTITNASTIDVKETVQIYTEAPYYKDGSKIEKSAKTLAAFDKFEVSANDSYDFTIRLNKDKIASYDDQGYYSANGSYVLEKGTYNVHLGKNAHQDWGNETFTQDETVAYVDSGAKNGAVAKGKRPTDSIVVTNQFDDINNYVKDSDMKILSRSDFNATWPTTPTTKTAPDYIVNSNKAFDSANDGYAGYDNPDSVLYKADAPVSGAQNGLTLSSLRGLDYDDPMWNDLLDQVDYTKTDELNALFTYGLYMTQGLESIGLVKTQDNDGPLGITATWSGTVGHVVACSYPCSPIVAATFNVDLIEEMGAAIGQESLTNSINGWYAPAVNIHRSAFGGRNFEYYSEDSILSGYIGAAMISGARSNGLFAHLKHFALNEMDRQRGKVMVFGSEQSLRERYLKSFEIAVEEAKCEEVIYDGETHSQKTVTIQACGAMMTSMSYIGPKFSANSYELLTTVLRDEWGFKGFVLTDFSSGANKSKDAAYRVGNDIWMGMKAATLVDLDKPTVQWCARNAIHNIAYTVVNSNAYNNVAPGAYVYYDVSPWKVGLIIADSVCAVIVLAGALWVVIRSIKVKD